MAQMRQGVWTAKVDSHARLPLPPCDRMPHRVALAWAPVAWGYRTVTDIRREENV